MGDRRLVGIDLGIASAHSVRVLDGSGSTLTKRKALPTVASLTAIEVAALEGAAPGTRLEVVVEPTGPAWLPIAVFFIERGHRVYRVSSAESADLRRYLSRHAKTNGIDADTLARIPLFNPHGVQPLELAGADAAALDRRNQPRHDGSVGTSPAARKSILAGLSGGGGRELRGRRHVDGLCDSRHRLDVDRRAIGAAVRVDDEASSIELPGHRDFRRHRPTGHVVGADGVADRERVGEFQECQSLDWIVQRTLGQRQDSVVVPLARCGFVWWPREPAPIPRPRHVARHLPLHGVAVGQPGDIHERRTVEHFLDFTERLHTTIAQRISQRHLGCPVHGHLIATSFGSRRNRLLQGHDNSRVSFVRGGPVHRRARVCLVIFMVPAEDQQQLPAIG